MTSVCKNTKGEPHFVWQPKWTTFTFYDSDIPPQWLIMKSPLLFDNQTSTLYKYTFQQFILKTIKSHIFFNNTIIILDNF